MILVHENKSDKGPDPYGAQVEIMKLLAKDPRNTMTQAAIEANILATCQCHAISALEHLLNSGAVTQPENSPTIFQLSPAGIDWCRYKGLRVASQGRYQPVEQPEDEQDAQEIATVAAAPKKRGRPRRVSPPTESL
jgi:hypothetical protein